MARSKFGDFLLGGLGEVQQQRQRNAQLQQALQAAMLEAQIKAQTQQYDPNQILSQLELANVVRQLRESGMLGGQAPQPSPQPIPLPVQPPAGAGIPSPVQPPTGAGIPPPAPLPIQGGVPQGTSPLAGLGARLGTAQAPAGQGQIPLVGIPQDEGIGKYGQKLPTKYKYQIDPRWEAEQKGLPVETGGKLAMVTQAKKDLQEVRKMLFPDGTYKSFARGLAFASNVPGGRAPIIGNIIPDRAPGNVRGEMIYSRLQNAVAAKLRVETGAQANPSEVENILNRFGITGLTNSRSAWDFLNRLEDFMDSTIRITDPTGRFSGTKVGRFTIAPNNGAKNQKQDNLSSLKSKYGLR